MKIALGIILRGEAACVANFIEEPEEGEDNGQDFSAVDFVIVPVVAPKALEKKSTGFDILSKLKQEGLFQRSSTTVTPNSYFDDGDDGEDMFFQSRDTDQRKQEKY